MDDGPERNAVMPVAGSRRPSMRLLVRRASGSHSRAADAFYGTVATAALAFVVLVVRPPEPRHEYLRRISLPPVPVVSESDGEGTLV